MSTIVTRSGKGSPLTHNEMDGNFTNLNTDKLEVTDLVGYATESYVDTAVATGLASALDASDIGVTVQAYSTNLSEYAAVNPTAAGLALLDDADAAAQLVTLGAQAALVSGTNIKTVNGSSLLGSGNLSVSVSDGDKGDITVSASGATWTIDNSVVSPAKLTQPYTFAASVSASGTAVDFTGIPSWARRITIIVRALSTNGSSNPIVQIGDSGGFKVTSYTGNTWQGNTTNVANNTGFLLNALTAAASAIHSATAVLVYDGSHWNFVVGGSYSTVTINGSGANSLSATLDRIRITMVNGTDTFDAGTIIISYEG